MGLGFKTWSLIVLETINSLASKYSIAGIANATSTDAMGEQNDGHRRGRG